MNPAPSTTNRSAVDCQHDLLSGECSDKADDLANAVLLIAVRNHEQLLEGRARTVINVELDLNVAIGSHSDDESS
jgi:hypothetical protein